MSDLLQVAMMAKQAAAEDPAASQAVEGLTRAQAAKMMAIGGGTLGILGGPAGIAGGALGGAIGGGLFGKGVDSANPITGMSKRYGNVNGVLSGIAGGVAGGAAGAAHGTLGALGGALGGAALGGGLGYGVGRVQGAAGAYAGKHVGDYAESKMKKSASEGVYSEELQLAKIAAEELYTAALGEANEKIAFAQALYSEAEGAEQSVKEAQDNGPAIGVPYIDQVKTPAGAAALGLGAGVGGVLGYMKNPSAVGAIGGGVLGAGVVAGTGALKSFIDQHRMARAQQHAMEMGILQNAGIAPQG